MTFLSRKTSKKLPHENAADRLRTVLKTSEASGYRLPAVAALADELGVSIPTVRKALNTLIAEGFVELRPCIGYFVKSAKVRQRYVALLYDLDLLPDSGIDHEGVTFILQAQSALQRLGIPFMVFLGRRSNTDTKLDATHLLEAIDAGLISGVLDLSGRPSDMLQTAVMEADIPLLGLGHYYSRGVEFDQMSFIRKAVNLASKKGFKRVAYMSAQFLHPQAGDGTAKVAQELKRCALEVREPWIRKEWHSTVSGGCWDTFRQIWYAYDDEKPDVIILGSPSYRQEIMLAMKDCGISDERFPTVIMNAAKGSLRNNQLPSSWPRLESDFRGSMDALAAMMKEALDGKELVPPKKLIDVWEVYDPSSSGESIVMDDSTAQLSNI